jgi:3-hydroxyisobutyrate dehydrogenase
MSSVGAAEADQLTQTAQAHAVTLIDAPVSGSTHPAEEGELTILASGPDSARTAVEPIFDALASRVLWVGAAGMGSRLKLAANHWMITMVAALAESMHLCQVMGLDQQEFIALLDGGPLGSTYASQKLDEMRRHQYPAGFPVRLALKDLQLRERSSGGPLEPQCRCWTWLSSASPPQARISPTKTWQQSMSLTNRSRRPEWK